MKRDTTFYTRLADAIGAEDAETAFARLSNETVSQAKQDAFYNELGILGDLGVSLGEQILDKIESVVSPRIQRLIQSERGINLADPETQAMVGQMHSGGVLTDSEYAALMGLASDDVLAWPGLTPDNVQDAIRMRAEGRA